MKRKYLCAAFLAVMIVGLSVFYGCSDKNTIAGTDSSSKWETVIDFQYDKVIVSPDSTFVVVKKGERYGAYVKRGDRYQILCSPKYNTVTWSANGEAILAKKGNKTEVFQENSSPLFQERFSKIKDGYYDNGFVASVDGALCGYLLRSNQWLLPADYLEIFPVAKGRYIVQRQDKSYDLLNNKNESLLSDELKLKIDGDASANLSNKYLIVIDKRTFHQGVINLDGELVLPTEYRSVRIREDIEKNTYFVTEDLLDLLSLMDDSGHVLVPATDCQVIDPITADFISIRKQKRWGAVNKTGEQLLPYQFDVISSSPINEIGFVSNNDDYWLIDRQGNRLSQEIYQNITISPSGLIKIQQNDKMGYLKKDASSYIPCLYDYGDDDFSDELLLVSKNQKLGFLDREGNTAIDFVYDFASPFQDGYALVIQGQKLGVINTKGELVVPFEFEAPPKASAVPYNLNMTKRNIMTNSGNKIYAVQKGDKWGCIRLK